MPVNGRSIHEIPEIGVFLGNNLNLTTMVFTWGLANVIFMLVHGIGAILVSKYKYMQKLQKPAKHIILSNVI